MCKKSLLLMGSRPPLGTLIVEHVDTVGENAVVGIDTQFFTVQSFLRGIKLIPAGQHLLHYSASVDDGTSMRYAWWFLCRDGDVLTVKWREEEACFTLSDSPAQTLGDMYQYMVSYPENEDKWKRLTAFIDTEALQEYLPRPSQAITTATALAEENMVLLEVLRSRKHDISVSDQSADELKYTIIQAQKKRANSVGHQVTRDALDRSWYLSELFGHDPELLLAEIQIAFIHFIVLCNLCSYTQWMNLLGLILSSNDYLRSHAGFATQFLDILGIQLHTMPADYILDSLGLQVVETPRLEKVLGGLNEVFEGKPSWIDLRDFSRQKLGLNPPLQKSLLDENEFEIYDLLNHDQDDENAPAIVL